MRLPAGGSRVVNVLNISITGQGVHFVVIYYGCTRSLMDRMMASDAVDAGSIPAGCAVFLWREDNGEQ